MSKFKMSLDLNVLNHLGLNLYSNVPAVLSEVVANSWDADAENVRILWEPELSQITITDDGIGMTAEDINNKYLTVGYQKREKGDSVTAKQRDVMGRKGIGKLSVFSIAEEVELHSVKNGIRSALVMNIIDIKETISNQNSRYSPKEIECDPTLTVGTKIILRKIKKKMLSINHDALRKRISRRFTIISPDQKFNVSVNEIPVTINDRDYFSKLQLCYAYKNDDYDVTGSLPKTTTVVCRNNKFDNYEITGWLSLFAVRLPKKIFLLHMALGVFFQNTFLEKFAQTFWMRMKKQILQQALDNRLLKMMNVICSFHRSLGKSLMRCNKNGKRYEPKRAQQKLSKYRL